MGWLCFYEESTQEVLGIRRRSVRECWKNTLPSYLHTYSVRVRLSVASKSFQNADGINPYGLAVASRMSRMRCFHRHIPECRDMPWLSSNSGSLNRCYI